MHRVQKCNSFSAFPHENLLCVYYPHLHGPITLRSIVSNRRFKRKGLSLQRTATAASIKSEQDHPDIDQATAAKASSNFSRTDAWAPDSISLLPYKSVT